MDTTGLTDVESAANDAYRAYYEAKEASEAAKEQITAAEIAYDDTTSLYYGEPSPENLEKMQEAQQALDAAKAEQIVAEEKAATAEAEAQSAAEAVEQKKEELRRSRHTDTAYVVHCARIECTYGMRDSYLALGPTHGVKTRQIPQMVAGDTIPDTNIINFGGCRSRENPTLRAAAEEAARKANEAIEEKTGWGGKFIDKVVGFFCGDQEIQVTDSLMAECMGECIACFPAGAEWRRGHEKVFINGEPVLLRRCSMRCNYGGEITILLSGQPE